MYNVMMENPAAKKQGIFTRMANRIKTAFTPVYEPIQAGSGFTPHRFSDYGSGAKSPAGMSRGASIMHHDHFALRQQTRDAMYDSTVCRAIVDRFADTIADTGLKLKPTPMADLLNMDEARAEEWAELVSERFHLWAKSKKSCRSGINTFYQNQRLYQTFQQRDNDVFVRFYYNREKTQPNPLQIDFVDPNQIRGYDFTSSYMQYPGDDGIVRDESGREIGYKIWYYDKQGGFKEKYVPAVGDKSGRIFMIHGYNPEYAGQGRGFPRLAHALQSFEQLTDLDISTIQKAINQASIFAAVENEALDPSNPLEGRVAGPVREYGSFPQPAADAQNVDNIEPVVTWALQPEATLTQPGTMIANLQRGDKLRYMQDTSPSADYDRFVASFVSHLSASVGMPVEILLMKFNANYSASRAAFITFWRVAQIWRDEMAADFLDPVYEMWLSEEIAAGRISAPGWSDPRLKAAWLCCEWAGSPMPNIDPLKTANADKAYAEMGAHTLDDIARNLNGSSGKANRAKNARQYQELPEPPWGQWTQVEPEPEKESDENEEE